MKRFLNAACVCLCLTLLTHAAVLQSPVPAPGPRVIQIVADHDNRFKLIGEPKQILLVQPNEQLLLRITAHRGEEMARDGAVHSLVIRRLRSEGWDIRLKEGTQDVPVHAPSAPGTYLIECTVRCGSGHDNMNLKMVVRP